MTAIFSSLTTIGTTQVTGSGTSSNDADAEMIEALASLRPETVSSTNVLTVDNVSDTWRWTRNMTWRITDAASAPSGAITITFPDAPERGIFGFVNDCTQDATITTSGQVLEAPIVSRGDGAVLAHDGTNIHRLAGTPSESLRAHVTTLDKLVTATTVAMWVADRAIVFDADFAGSGSWAKNVASTGTSVTFSVAVNGSTIGNMTFGAGASTATFSTVVASTYTVAVNERIEVVSPGNLQSMDNIAFTIKARPT